MCESTVAASHTAFVRYCTGGSSPVCVGQVWHWSAGNLTRFSLPGSVVTAAGGHVWLLADTHAQTQSGRVTVYESDNSGLEKIAAIGAPVAAFPQIAASSAGRVWVLDQGRGAHGRGGDLRLEWQALDPPRRPEIRRLRLLGLHLRCSLWRLAGSVHALDGEALGDH